MSSVVKLEGVVKVGVPMFLFSTWTKLELVEEDYRNLAKFCVAPGEKLRFVIAKYLKDYMLHRNFGFIVLPFVYSLISQSPVIVAGFA